MTKTKFKSYKSNDRYGDDEDEEFETNSRNKVDKRSARRFDRALRTRDVSALIEDEEELDFPETNYYMDEIEDDDNLIHEYTSESMRR